ncbi:helix-turn-helix domain-containing protein [Streptomyces sp. NPDC029674]|uniref:nSTAND1 domain-containing NTPase n=1 Tax=Streptomyces sp. NPDC029674 TaxID=3365297 RepID=UPI00384DD45C
MGRPEAELDPGQGPVQRFAFELRKLRQEAGGITYRRMARQVEVSVSTLSRAAAGEQLPSLPVALAYVRACAGDAEEWERRWREAATEQARAADLVADDTVPSPYRGLARFGVGDAELFFGRDELTDALVRTVTEHRVVAVFGPSGSGKSSLLRAGLVPRLRGLDGARRPAAVRILTPGEHPLRTHDAVCVPAPGEGDTWLVVDQFEEVFTLCRDTGERAGFLARLLAAAEPGSRLRVVLGVRADFYAHCLAHPELAEAVRESTVPVGPMGADALRAVIVKPAQAHGLIVERALTARLTEQAAGEPGGLPLLSHALLETWRRRRGRTLTLEAYEATGGIHAAVAQTAEELYGRLSPDRCLLVRRILLRLITPGEGAPDTRRPVERAELDLGDPDGVARVLADLAAARLVTLDDDRVDLAHESLISSWPRFRQWVEEDRELLRAHRQLTEAARTWDDLGCDQGAVYRGARLDTADELFAAPERAAALTSLERSFLAASRAARTGERRRRHGLIGALSLLVVLSLVAGAVAWQQGRTSDRRHAEAEARRIAAVAENMRYSDPVLAMRLSVAAWRLAETTETRSALLGAVTQREEDTFAVPGAETASQDTDLTTGRHLVDGGRTLVSVAPDRITTWDVRTHRRTHAAPGLGRLNGAGTVAVGPDGRRLAVATYDGVVLWDVRAGRVTDTLPTGPADTALFGPGGRTLVVDPGGAVEGDGPRDVQVWDLRTDRALLRVPLKAGETVRTALSADGRWLALCTDRRPLEIRDVTGRRKSPLPRPAGVSRHRCDGDRAGLAFGPDNRTLAFLTGSGIRRVDLRSGKELPKIDERGLTGLRFSADGRFLAATGLRGLLLWRLSDPADPVFRQPLPAEASTRTAEFELDPDTRVARYLNAPTTVVRSLNLGPVATARWTEHVVDEAYPAPDGRTLAVLRYSGSPGAGYRLLDTRSGRVRHEPREKPCPEHGMEQDPSSDDPSSDDMPRDDLALCVDLMAFSGDGRFFAHGRGWSASKRGTATRQRVTVRDVRTGREHAVIDLPGGDEEAVQSIALSHDGSVMAAFRTATGDAVDVWDVRTGRRVEKLRRDNLAPGQEMGSEGGGFGLQGQRPVLSPDADTAVAPDGVVADLSSGRVGRRSLGDDLATALAFSPDGDRLAVGDASGRVALWDGAVDNRLGQLSGTHLTAYEGGDVVDDGIAALAYSADGRTLAVGGASGTVQLWDVPSNRPLGSALLTPGGPLRALSFSADGGTLYASSAHMPLQKYALAPDRLAEQSCARAGGGLTEADWKTYLPDMPYRQTCGPQKHRPQKHRPQK